MIGRSVTLAIVTFFPMLPVHAAAPVRSVEGLYRMCEMPISRRKKGG